MSMNGPAGTSAERAGQPASDDILQQVERISANPIFRKSDILRNLLAFLVEGSLASPETSFREHEIATKVLGRSDDFDPRLDSAVRVHTARLRTRLAEYYAGEGKNDPVVFEIPKGAYQVAIRRNAPEEPPPAPRPQEDAGGRAGRLLLVLWACAATLTALMLAYRGPAAGPEAPAALDAFWSDLASPDEQTTLIFPHSKFLAKPGGLEFISDASVAPEVLNDLYTGIGEVYGASALAGMFAEYWRPIRVKCGKFLTWDDARRQNLVFVGGPDVHLQLGQLPELERFRFASSVLEDARADPAAPLRYGNSGRPFSYDHAVIGRIRMGSGRTMLVLAGTMTLGTQAAVDFVTREDTVRLLLDALESPPPGPVPEFEALLRVDITGGAPMHSRILAVHIRK
jgi:hypothetical protein